MQVSYTRNNAKSYPRLRRRIAFLVCIFTAIVLSLLKTQFVQTLKPGPLTQAHSQILQGNNCSACHPGIAQFATHSPKHVAMTQSKACIQCHHHDLKQLLRGSPHDLASSELINLQKSDLTSVPAARIWLTSLKSVLTESPFENSIDWQHQSFACGDCHSEHQGKDFLLSSMDSTRCQACHQQRFNSFDGNHPEFNDYPKAKSAIISFDHRSHSSKHFLTNGAAFDCNRCHLDSSGETSRLVRSTGFDIGCASCHREPLTSSLADGIVFWQLPSIDIARIKEASKSVDSVIAKWPDSASYVNDLTLTPMMQSLLVAQMQTDGADASIISQLRDVENIADLPSQDDQASLVAIAAAAKHVLYDLAQNGQAAMQTQLQVAVNGSIGSNAESFLNAALVEPMLRGVTPEIFAAAYQRWFNIARTSEKSEEENAVDKFRSDTLHKNSSDDLMMFGALEPEHNAAPKSTPTFSQFESRQHVTHGGWIIDADRMAIVYIPIGHGDPWMQAYAEWLIAWSEKEDNALPQRMFEQSVVSSCLECHRQRVNQTIDKSEPMNPLAVWHSADVDPTRRSLTRFDHKPHLKLPQLADCNACHLMNQSKLPQTRLVSTDSVHASRSNLTDFAALSKQTCVACHNRTTAVQQCTLCHDYHVGQ